MADELRRQMALACSPARAFRAFTDHVDLWWPRSHRRSRDHTMRFTGDSLIQIAADGSAWTMARVLVFEPPHRLELDWFAGAVNDPTHVAITFAGDETATTVTIVHRPLTPETVALWPKRVSIFVAGWDAVLAGLKQHTDGGADA